MEAVSPGTLIFPTFSYSFCNHEDYNPKTSLSLVGALSNAFLKRKESIRSLDPIFSIAAIGPRAEYFTRIEKNVCFGKGSFFGKAVKENIKIMGFGIELVPVLTWLHQVEEVNKSTYRFDKIFDGNIIVGDKVIKASQHYFVRDLAANFQMNSDDISDLLRKKKVLKSVPFGNAVMEVLEAAPAFEILSEAIIRDPDFFIIK